LASGAASTAARASRGAAVTAALDQQRRVGERRRVAGRRGQVRVGGREPAQEVVEPPAMRRCSSGPGTATGSAWNRARVTWTIPEPCACRISSPSLKSSRYLWKRRSMRDST
jgi:hypothetical protein